jgi:hypothetical protein
VRRRPPAARRRDKTSPWVARLSRSLRRPATAGSRTLRRTAPLAGFRAGTGDSACAPPESGTTKGQNSGSRLDFGSPLVNGCCIPRPLRPGSPLIQSSEERGNSDGHDRDHQHEPYVNQVGRSDGSSPLRDGLHVPFYPRPRLIQAPISPSSTPATTTATANPTRASPKRSRSFTDGIVPPPLCHGSVGRSVIHAASCPARRGVRSDAGRSHLWAQIFSRVAAIGVSPQTPSSPVQCVRRRRIVQMH